MREKQILVLFAVLLGLSLPALAQNNQCDQPGEAPDVIVGDLVGVTRYGVVGDITAFSIGTTSCNIGTCWLNWISNNNQHPVIGQNLYRLLDGKFEQLGQSWLKHGFTALNGNLCSGGGCIGTNGDHLGVNCSDPYSSGLNGSQNRLGPKFEVNAYTGVYAYPYTDQGQTGNAIYKRLQVHSDDLNPGQNAGALYFAEGHYVTNDDASAGNHTNNASWRRMTVSGSAGSGNYDLDFTGSTQREEPAIFAWADNDPTVELTAVGVPNEGRFWVGAKATALGGGIWRYEYAVFNLNSHRSGQAFSVPLPAGTTPTNVGFHDVDYHSGEPYDGTDWSSVVDNGTSPPRLRWSTTPYSQNQNANALRWSTLYNFRFDVASPPVTDVVQLDLFRPGTPSQVTFSTTVPSSICDDDGQCEPPENEQNCAADCGIVCGDAACEPGENPCTCPDDCGTPTAFEFTCDDAIDDDCDGRTDCEDADCCPEFVCKGANNDGDAFELCEDCDDLDGTIWDTPGEALDLFLAEFSGFTLLTWFQPIEPGGTSWSYRGLRTASAADFMQADCLPDDDPDNLKITELESPPSGVVWHYLVRAVNNCDSGEGSLGGGDGGSPRSGVSCP
ncbi:MAG: hypothetical protein GY716_17070 [bacterium]|nr:hypothetical protein [bacterium]